MRILVVGDWHSDLHEEETSKSLRRLGHKVNEFKWFTYFDYEITKYSFLGGLFKRIQDKYIIGSLVQKMNLDLVAFARECRPQVILIYRGTHVYKNTLLTIKEYLPESKLIGYNNDDPFSPIQTKYLWRHFKAGIPVYDMLLAYREHNIKDYKQAGAKKVELMRSWYVPDRNFPVKLTHLEQQDYDCDVVFIGHYEPDERVSFLEAIVQAGYHVRLFGPTKYWQKPLEKSDSLRNLAPIKVVWGTEYNKALCGAKIALCFFSKLNRDTYTRRCFEIPATRTFMLSEYSDDIATLYKKGVEADFFSSKDEMLELIDYYLKNNTAREKVASQGYEKVRSAGYDIDSRVSNMLRVVSGEL